MRAMWAWIVSALCTVGFVTGTLFYVIPKYAEHNETGYVKFIDKVGAFIANNWAWLLVVVALVVALTVVSVMLVKRRK